MGKFSKINSFFLVIAVLTVTLGQIQPSSWELPIYPNKHDSDTTGYSGLSNPLFWGLIDFESNASLFNLLSNNNSEVESEETIVAEKAREASLENYSTLYLLDARDIDVEPTIGELLYPFHFYF